MGEGVLLGLGAALVCVRVKVRTWTEAMGCVTVLVLWRVYCWCVRAGLWVEGSGARRRGVDGCSRAGGT